ncbi:hypothetical protein Tco_1546258 [Tanacetum coccineum]
MTVGEVNIRVTELAELHEHDTQDLYALLEDAQDSRTRISQRVTMDSQRVELLMGDRMTLQRRLGSTPLEGRICFSERLRLCDRIAVRADIAYSCRVLLIQSQHQAQMVETLRVMRDISREMGDMQAELLALREQQRRARQPGPDVRVLDHQDASKDADSHI